MKPKGITKRYTISLFFAYISIFTIVLFAACCLSSFYVYPKHNRLDIHGFVRVNASVQIYLSEDQHGVSDVNSTALKSAQENENGLSKVVNSTVLTKLAKSTPLSNTGESNSSVTFNDVLTPPENITSEERIAWFKERIPRIEVLESTKKSRWFDQRMKQLFDVQGINGTKSPCTVRIFMTWVGPARHFGIREFLSLESILKAHPEGCVVLVSRSMDSNEGRTILEPLLSRGYKVYPVTPDLTQLFDKTPAQAWLDDLIAGKIDPGKIPISQNLSNLIRYVLLYKYGGIYLDMDMIILRDISGIRNSIGIQDVDEHTKAWTALNNAVLIFDKEHPLVLSFIEEFTTHFDGNIWGNNGPYMVTRVVNKVANNTNFQFSLLPQKAFYPVHWSHVGMSFNQPRNEKHGKWLESQLRMTEAGSYGVHLWNKFSRNLKIVEGSVMGRLISSHCIICQGIYD